MLAGVRETGEKPVDVFTDQEFGHEDALLLINAEVGVEDDASTDDLAGGRFEVYEGEERGISEVRRHSLLRLIQGHGQS